MNTLVAPGPWCQGAMTQAVPGGQHQHPAWCVGNSTARAFPSPRLPSFLPSTAAANAWILPQDAPSECENSSSARSHGNCSLVTQPHLLFSSQCSCVRPPRAAHEAVTAATSPGPQTHPVSPTRLPPLTASPSVTVVTLILCHQAGSPREGLFLGLRSSTVFPFMVGPLKQ